MLLTLYDKRNNRKMEIAPSDSSTCSKAVQSDNVLSLSFVSYECKTLEVNDYIDFCGERFWATDRYTPRQKSTVEWEYDIKLYGIESLIKRYLVVKLTNGDNETEFSYTATAYDHVTLIVQNINAGMDTSDWKVGEVVTSEYLVVDYEGTYCDEGLKKVADLTGVEYWIEGTTVNVSRCEHGERITLGYDKGLTSLYSDKADNVKFFTRLFPIGSTRNIAHDTYGHSRLQLPSGVKYIDQDIDRFGVVHHYEKEAFSHIYPRRIGNISNVRFEEVKGEDGKPFTIYYFKDSSLNFNPNEYEMNGLVKMVSFQDNSSLAGRDFEVNYNDKTKEFEIITQWPYDNDIQLPNEQLSPKVLDEYILWNIKMPVEYYALAEVEFKKAVEEFMERQYNDVSVYKAHTDYIDISERGLNLTIGQRVRLEHSNYFAEGYRDSRITKITRKVVRPTDMDIEISDVLSKGALEKVDDSIADISHYTKVATGGFPDILRSWDNTTPTDTNVFSSRKALKESLSRLRDDIAKGLISFLKGINIGEYLRGEQGATIDPGGNAEFLTVVIRELLRSTKFVDGMFGEGFQLWIDKLTGLSNLTIDKVTIRQSLVAMELLIEKVRSVGGQFIVSAANGKIKTAIRNGDVYTITFEQANTFVAHDMMRCAVFSGTQMRGYWVEVSTADSEKITVPASEFNGAEPLEGDECVLMGNTENPLRQNLISISATEDGQPRVDILNGIKTKGFENCLRARFGNLDGINDSHFPAGNQPHDDGLYSNNAYLRGTFMLVTGEDVKTKFEITEGLVHSAISAVRTEINEKYNYLSNASFSDNTEKWEAASNIRLFTVSARFLCFNENFYSDKQRVAAVVIEGNRRALRLKKTGVKQLNANLAKKPILELEKPEDEKAWPTFYLAFKYKCVKRGTLKIGFPDKDLFFTETLNETDIFLTKEYSATWDGTGDFTIDFTGDIYIYSLSLADNPLENYKIETDTRFYQTDSRIGLWAGKTDKIAGTVTTLGLDLDALEGKVLLYANKTDSINNTVLDLGISLDATNGILSLYANKTDTINGTVTQLGIDLNATRKDLTLFVKDADLSGHELVSRINLSPSSVQISSKNINLQGAVTFSSLKEDLYDAFNEKVSTNSIGDMAYYDKVAQAMTHESLLIGGYFNTTLIKAQEILAQQATIGGFSIDAGRLVWTLVDYFGGTSRGLMLGKGSSDEGVVNVTFSPSTDGRFGVKSVGAASGGAAIYGSSKVYPTYPDYANTWAGFFDGPVHVTGDIQANGFYPKGVTSVVSEATLQLDRDGAGAYEMVIKHGMVVSVRST